jgi:hypothetical protein
MPKKVEKYKQFVENLGIDRRYMVKEKVQNIYMFMILCYG